MRYARIENNKVAEISDFGSIEGRFHESLIWVECPLEVNNGWTYDGASFSAPIPKTPQEISDAKDAKSLELDRAKDAFAACLEVVFAFVKNPALYTTANQLKQAAVAAYRAKL